jgi:hypothetical protein
MMTTKNTDVTLYCLCPKCGGSGQVADDRWEADVRSYCMRPCPDCKSLRVVEATVRALRDSWAVIDEYRRG